MVVGKNWKWCITATKWCGELVCWVSGSHWVLNCNGDKTAKRTEEEVSPASQVSPPTPTNGRVRKFAKKKKKNVYAFESIWRLSFGWNPSENIRKTLSFWKLLFLPAYVKKKMYSYLGLFYFNFRFTSLVFFSVCWVSGSHWVLNCNGDKTAKRTEEEVSPASQVSPPTPTNGRVRKFAKKKKKNVYAFESIWRLSFGWNPSENIRKTLSFWKLLFLPTHFFF